MSESGWNFVDRILNNANDLCLVLNPSVNSYRRLDPAYEAPNQIKASAVDRTSLMVRIPGSATKNPRAWKIRSVAPDANPYLTMYTAFRTGLEGPITETLDSESRRTRTRFLPSNIYDAMRHFKSSELMVKLLGEETQTKYLELKQQSADRCPRLLGAQVKTGEIIFHHDVTNQYLWHQLLNARVKLRARGLQRENLQCAQVFSLQCRRMTLSNGRMAIHTHDHKSRQPMATRTREGTQTPGITAGPLRVGYDRLAPVVLLFVLREESFFLDQLRPEILTHRLKLPCPRAWREGRRSRKTLKRFPN